MHDSTRPDAFRRLPAEYDNLVPHADMINDLRTDRSHDDIVDKRPDNVMVHAQAEKRPIFSHLV